MKKIKQIDTYYCDYCGKECEHTPEFVLPSRATTYAKNTTGAKVLSFDYVEPAQKDICPKCQKKVVSLLTLTDRVKLGNSIGGMEITF